MRIKVLRLIVLFLFALVVIDLTYVQVVRGKYYYNLSINNRIRVISTEGNRGKIIDRNGNVLADNLLSYNLMVIPQDIRDSDKLFSFLAKVLKTDKGQLQKTYQQKKFAPFTPVLLAEDINQSQVIAIEENKFLYPSIFIQESFKRYYPYDVLAAHVLGYVGRINRAKMAKYKEYGYSPESFIGYSGVEEYYDEYLKGGQGGQQIEVNSQGKQVRLLSLKEPTDGKDIGLTIDINIQRIAQEVMAEDKGVIIVMDSQTGEVLSLTSNPSYNPNYLTDPQFSQSALALFRNPNSPMLNRAITSVFPPGSVFKIPVALGALNAKKATENTSIECLGFLELGGTRFGCSHVHGLQNLVQAIAHSCNVYFFHLGTTLGVDLISYYAHSFGLGAVTNIDLPFEAKGFIPNRNQRLKSSQRRWYAGDTLNLSIGQGDALVTPIQLLNMMATVANKGIEVQPHVISSIDCHGVVRDAAQRRSNIDDRSYAIVHQGMRSSVTDYSGTANGLAGLPFYVAGKTGTAQSSANKEHHAWFVGFTKKTKQDITFCIFLEHGGSSTNAVIKANQLLTRLQAEELI